MTIFRRAFLIVLWLGGSCAACAQPTPQRIIESKTDILGEASLRQPGGPSYEFFEKVLPPLRYVDARYKHYPIVLSAPRSLVKGKVLSTGGIINPLARHYQWVGEAGIPWHVTLGSRHVP